MFVRCKERFLKQIDEVKRDLKRFVEIGADWIIFTTGIGFETLIEQADDLECKDEFMVQVKTRMWPQGVIKQQLH